MVLIDAYNKVGLIFFTVTLRTQANNYVGRIQEAHVVKIAVHYRPAKVLLWQLFASFGIEYDRNTPAAIKTFNNVCMIGF